MAPDNPLADPVRPGRKLRFGVLLDSMIQPAWVERALRRVIESGVADAALVVRNAVGEVRESQASGPRSWWVNRDLLLYRLYEHLDRRRFSTPDDPLRPVEVGGLLRDVPQMTLIPVDTQGGDRFEAADIQQIREAHLDVLFRFGFRNLSGDILTAARLGVWSYHHGDSARYRGGPPCFWEVMEGSAVTGVVLQRLTEDPDGGLLLYRSYSATNPISVAKNRVETYWKGAEFLARVVRRHAGADDEQEQDSPPPTGYGHKLYVAPGNATMAAGLARLTVRRLRSGLESRLLEAQWFLAYSRSPRGTTGLPDVAPYRFREIMPPGDRYWADPFPVQSDGAEYILFEEVPYRTEKGRISIIRLGEQGPTGPALPVLERDYHLSYPHVFTWRGSHFMIPETADVRRVEVYRAVRFPFEWTLESVSMEGESLCDCTLAEIDGRWWMFATAAAEGASYWDELHVFHGPAPLGPWTPHPRNPVVSDVRSARPAGRLFTDGRRWYRPSQDSSHGYGWALGIQQIVRLDVRSYEERAVTKVLPDWRPGLKGIHTLNSAGGLTVVDVCHSIPRFRRSRTG